MDSRRLQELRGQDFQGHAVEAHGGGYGAERTRLGQDSLGGQDNLGGGVSERVTTVTPFEVHVAGVKLKVWRNPYEKVAMMERSGPRVEGVRAVAVEVVAKRMAERVKRFLGPEWAVVRGEGW